MTDYEYTSKMKQNLHTHSTYCDGKDTPREMVERALELGLDSLGFSGHANTSLADDCEMRNEKMARYIEEVSRLKEEYRDRIKIYLGCELDYYSPGYLPNFKFDYTIASVHYTVKDGVAVPFDYSAKRTKDAIARLFGGDAIEYVRSYYEKVATMHQRLGGDFVGHFDLVTKFSETNPEIFDTGSTQYRKIALEALHATREKYEFFEVNTGAIGRGYRKTPYPDPFILEEMKRINCKLLITSDCHNRMFLDCAYTEALELVRAAGFDEIYYLSDKGFVGRKIK